MSFNLLKKVLNNSFLKYSFIVLLTIILSLIHLLTTHNLKKDLFLDFEFLPASTLYFSPDENYPVQLAIRDYKPWRKYPYLKDLQFIISDDQHCEITKEGSYESLKDGIITAYFKCNSGHADVLGIYALYHDKWYYKSVKYYDFKFFD